MLALNKTKYGSVLQMFPTLFLANHLHLRRNQHLKRAGEKTVLRTLEMTGPEGPRSRKGGLWVLEGPDDANSFGAS